MLKLGMIERMLLKAVEPEIVHQVTRHVADAVAAAEPIGRSDGIQFQSERISHISS